MELAAPAALLLGLLVVPLWWLLRRRRPGVAIPTVAAIAGLRPTWRVRASRFLPVLRLAAVAFLVVALARPRVGEATTVIPAEGIDIVLSMDLSSSMSSGQFGEGVSRLEGARQVVREFIASREDDRIGIVIFQEDAIPISPPTLDHEALDTIVAELKSGILPDGTALGLGLAVAVDMVEESNAASRVAILLTDGRHNNDQSIHPSDAARVAASVGVRVYTIGITSPAVGAGTSVDEGLLTSVAEATGGQYFSAATVDDLAAVYEEIGRLETTTRERDRYTTYTEYGPWLVLAGAGLLLADFALRSTLFRSVTA
jgi:Ca-activated chloride channel family protein